MSAETIQPAGADQPTDALLLALDQVRKQLATVVQQLDAVKARTLEQAAFARVLEQVDRYLTFEEAGVILGVDRTTVARAVTAGQLQRVQAPGTETSWRVPLSSVQELQRNQVALAEMQRKAAERRAAQILAAGIAENAQRAQRGAA